METDNKRADNPYDDTFKYRFVKVIYDIIQIKSRAILFIFLRKKHGSQTTLRCGSGVRKEFKEV